jgi:hypothetical protein
MGIGKILVSSFADVLFGVLFLGFEEVHVHGVVFELEFILV